MFPSSRRHTRQPQLAVLDQGLGFASFLLPSAGVDLCSGRSPSVAGSVTRVAALNGVAYSVPVSATRTRVEAASNDSLLIPASGCTIVLAGMATTLGTFGEFGEESGNTANRAGAHVPYTDGTVYFDWGGTTAGTTRVTASGLSFSDSDVWIFTTGPRGMEIWQNGVLRASNAANPTRTQGSGPWGLGQNSGVGGSDAGRWYALGVIRSQVPREIAKRLSKNLWETAFLPADRPIFVGLTAAAGGSLSLTPGPAALVLTGYAPTVAQTTTLALTPSTAALALTGYAPSVALTTNLTPGVGALTLTGYAPTVTQSSALALTPDPAALTLTGYVPTVSQTANLSLSPGPAALALTGYSPAITQTTTLELTPGVSTLTLTGYAPVVTQGSVVDTMVRPGLDVATTGWASSTGGTLVGAINETVASDAEYIFRPVASSQPFDFELWLNGVAHPLPAGSHVVRMRADVTAGAAQARLLLLDASDNVVGTGAWQSLTPSLATTTFTVDSTATATKGRIEAMAA